MSNGSRGSLRYESAGDTADTVIGTQLSREQYTYVTVPGSPIFGSLSTSYSSITNQTCQYEYSSYTCLLETKIIGSKRFLYRYDDSKHLIEIIEGKQILNDSGSVVWESGGDVEYNFTDWDGISSIHTDTTTYSFSYNEWHQNTGITAGSFSLYTAFFQSGNGHITMRTTGNGYFEIYEYDDLDRLASVCYYGAGITTVCSYKYDALGRISRYIDRLNNINVDYTYDAVGNIAACTTYIGETKCVNTFNVYDTDGKPTSSETSFSAGGTSYTEQTSFSYDSLDFPDRYSLTVKTGSNTTNYVEYSEDSSHDTMGHLNTQSEVFRRYNSTLTSDVNYTYYPNTNLVKSRTATVAGVVSTDEKYAYDGYQYLTTVKDGNGNTKYRYHYDTIGQLIRVDDAVKGKSIVYTYDGNGNRLSAITYPYTLTNMIYTTPTKTELYGYGRNGWGDLLVSYTSANGITHALTYDGAGYPINYYNSDTLMTMSWTRGSLLSQIRSGNNLYQYSQDNLTFAY